jgi:NAD(P) transhydrogenase
MSGYDFDLAVIGSGPAGEKAAAQAAWFGKRVVVIEKHTHVGGACVNTGTLPSKTLRETALYLTGFRQRGLYGFQLEVKRDVSVPDFMCRQEPVCATELSRIQRNLERHNVPLERGAARFVDAHTLEITHQGQARRLTADAVLIAVGSTPYRPAQIPFSDPDVDDSDTILKLDRIPRAMVVLGGGVIGCEYASIFAALGVQVTLVEGRDRLLPFLDLEIAELLTRQLAAMGVELRFKAECTGVERHASGLEVQLSTGEKLAAEKLLYAAGRSGNTAGLGLEALGVQPDKRGLLKVDQHYRVAGAPGGRIYAAGDVIGFPALASTSMEQGRVAACHAFDIAYKQRVSDHLPFGIYTIPEVSMVGESEQTAEQKGIDAVVGRARYRDNARGQIVGDLDGLLKLVFRADDKRLLGVHIIGERATELVHVGQMVIHYGGSIDDFIDEVFNYPTLAEMYKYAAYDGLGNLARRNALTCGPSVPPLRASG